MSSPGRAPAWARLWGAAMSIRVRCPNCQSVAACPDEYRGKALRCKKCGQPFVAGPPGARKAAPAPRPAAPPAPAPARKRGGGRFLVVALLAALVGAGVGFPAAYFALKKGQPPDGVAAGPAATAPGDGAKPPDGPPAPPATTGKEEWPRDTGTKPRPVEAPVVWKDFTSREGRFSARFPGAPQVTSSKSPSGKPTLTFAASVAAAPGGKPASFSVSHSDFDPRDTADAAAFLDAITAELAGEKKPLKLGGHLGVELRGEEKDREGAVYLTTQRFYVVRARMYHLIASGPRDKDLPPLFDRFFDSFALLEPGEPEPAAGHTPRDRALAWLGENAAAPAGKVADQARGMFDDRVKEGSGFTLAAGEAVVKSKRPALLAGWGGELFPFELTAEQAKALKLAAGDLILTAFPQPAGPRPEKPPFVLSELKINGAAPKLAGAVAYRRGAAVAGPLVLRLSYPAGASLRVRRQLAEPKAESGTLPFSFPPVTADDPEVSGPVVVLVEVCSAESAGKPEAVLSNPVAALVTVPPAPKRLADLRLTAPEGWKVEYSTYRFAWLVTKPPPTPRSQEEVVRIEECPADAQTPAAYAAGLKEKDFLEPETPGWASAGDKGDLPDGFLFKGVVKKYDNPKTPPILGLVAVREINGLKVRCYSANLRSEASRDEALELFKGAKFGPAK